MIHTMPTAQAFADTGPAFAGSPSEVVAPPVHTSTGYTPPFEAAIDAAAKSPAGIVIPPRTETGPGVATVDVGDFDDLNALLSDAMAHKALEDSAKAARKRLSASSFNGSASPAERAADEARIREWEARVEWIPRATCAFFEETTCSTCNTRGSAEFKGYFERQDHKQLRNAQRWLAAPAPREDLPRETYLRQRLVHLCEDCAPASGWDLADAKVWA